MSFDLIMNRARFNQKADFSNIVLSGTDVDFFTEIDNKYYVLIEWKSRFANMPTGQTIGFNRLAADLGQIKPVFHLIAYHDTEVTHSIHGDNSYVRQVIYRLPNMAKHENYYYKAGVPSVNQWLGDFSYEWRIQKILKKGSVPLWEGIPVADDNLAVITQPTGPSAFFDHIREIRHSYECR